MVSLPRLADLPAKFAANFALLRRDPERFGHNLLQVTNPSLFEERLSDMLGTVPMHARVVPGPMTRPRLNVLDSAWSQSGMTGGPNTVLNLAARVARLGIEVRLVATVRPPTLDPAWFARHVATLVGGAPPPPIPVVSASDPSRPLALGPSDVFLATHWSTARQLKPVLERLPIRQFLYMLQEFEPGFYPMSSNHALALETFEMDFWPLINEAMLADYLFGLSFGRLSDPAMRRRAVVFEPAVDGTLFYPGEAGGARRRRLLFYARPTNTRNMFGLGLAALRLAAADPAFAGWEFLSIGGRGSVPALALGHGHVLRPAPWMDYAGYGDLLRRADLLLCPMLSPHTSYPVLEMAACGGLSVTNVFATKTLERLRALSDNIVATPATVEGMAAGLVQAARSAAAGPRTASLNMARDWGAVLDPASRRVADIVTGLQGAEAVQAGPVTTA